MKKKPLIGLLSELLLPIPAYELASDLNIDLVVFTPYSINWSLQKIHGLFWDGEHWIKTTTRFPDAVYNRRYTSSETVINRLEQYIGKNKVFNRITKLDKWKTHRILSASLINVGIPNTQILTKNSFNKMISHPNGVILKPRIGSFGEGVFLLQQKDKHYHLFEGSNQPIVIAENIDKLIATMAAKPDYLIQGFIPPAPIGERIFDIRLIMQKGADGNWNASASLSRLSLKNVFITNLCRRIQSVQESLALLSDSINPEEFLLNLETVSLKVCSTLEKRLGLLGDISVDFIIDNGYKPWLIEVNGKPEKANLIELLEPELMEKVYSRPLEYAKMLAEK